jgi:hypothetical protein
MKHSKMLIPALLTLVALFLAACGGNKPQPAEGLTKGSASEFGGIALDSHKRLLAMIPGGAGLSSLALSSGKHIPKQLASVLPLRGLNVMSTGEECITFAGDFTDADADEIPVDASFAFDCAYTEEGGDVTVKGNAHFQDADDNDAFSGYTIEFVDFTVTESKDGQMNTLELDQTFVLSIAADKSLYIVENDLELHASTPQGSFTYSELATLGYAPDDLANPFLAGTFALNSVTTWQSGEDVYTLTGASPALHYSESCESSFDAGTIAYEDNFGNSLGLIFNACNDVTVIYNGSPLANGE